MKEKAGIASSVEAPRTEAVHDGEHVTVEGSSHVEQPDTVVVEEMEAVEVRKCNVEFNREALACEPRQEGVEAGPECDEAIPKSDDVISFTTAKAPAAERGGPRRGEEVDVGSNSSENVSSGLSDEGCAVFGKGVVVQGSGGGVVDEGSGIGKCCSSDDLDMGVGMNPNALSVLENPSKVVGSPSSLGCPSSSNLGKRLVVKRGGMRVSKSIDNHEMEVEPLARTGEWSHSDPFATFLFN